ncbi:hypothetical protein MTR67_012011 [Solanum verrucosum]|uniref:Uncharacterized protein n=1 Tax=Solanum verrucosum TaxID=315347 RepID=A0AAF0QDQ3_SOLVR|nr:hypothetical protein MTR67_012011 [Solanum verrucosum]
MLIRDKVISRLMVFVQQVEEEKQRDREEFKNKRAKTGNEFRQQKSNANWSSVQQKQNGPPHHPLVHLHLRTKVSTIVRMLELNLPYSYGSMVQGGSKLDVQWITSSLSIHELQCFDGVFTRMEFVWHVWMPRREFHALHGNIFTLTELKVGQHHAWMIAWSVGGLTKRVGASEKYVPFG